MAMRMRASPTSSVLRAFMMASSFLALCETCCGENYFSSSFLELSEGSRTGSLSHIDCYLSWYSMTSQKSKLLRDLFRGEYAREEVSAKEKREEWGKSSSLFDKQKPSQARL
jgi:hypothetical protein